MNKKLVTLLLASALLLGGCVNINPNDVENEVEEMTSQETVEQPAPESTLNESTLNESRGLTFKSAENNTCYVTGIGTCKDSTLVIPATSPKGEIVVGVDDMAFYQYPQICSVKFPDTVKSIGERAFQNCWNLYSVDLNKVETIGAFAFCENSRIEYIYFPNTVKSIGTSAFEYCSFLRTVDLNKVETIGDYAFFRCDFSSISIPKSVKNIGKAAFSGSEDLASIRVEPGNLYYYSVGKYYLIEERTGTLILGCLVGNFHLNDDCITKIGDYAFSFCESMTSLDISQSKIKEIGDFAFEFCTSLELIHLPENLETIGEGAFSNCSSLKHLEIPEQVNFPNGTRNLFRDCVKLESVKLPENIEQIGIYCFLRCYSLKSFVISSRVTEIGELAFSGCESLNSLTVEEGNQIFISQDGCVIDPSTKTLVAIAANAEIPTDGSVEILADGLFSFLNRDYMAIPEGVKKLGRELFDGAMDLESVSIPHSAEDFSEDTFRNAWGLKTIYYNGTVAEWRSLVEDDSWMTWTEKLTIQCTDGEIRITCSDPAIG